ADRAGQARGRCRRGGGGGVQGRGRRQPHAARAAARADLARGRVHQADHARRCSRGRRTAERGQRVEHGPGGVMNGVLTVARREIASFFMSPMAYVVMTVWLLFFGIVFYALAFFFSQQPPGGGQNLLQAFFGGTTLFW